MATKNKKSSKSRVKIGALSKPKKALGNGDMKKVKGGATPNKNIVHEGIKK
jgi:hypothetical protein